MIFVAVARIKRYICLIREIFNKCNGIFMSPKIKTSAPVMVEVIKNGYEGKAGVSKLGVNGFARATEISPALISRYLQDKIGEPTTATLQKLADYFGVTVAYLRGEEPATLKGKTPLMVVKRLKKAVLEKGENRVAEETGIVQSEIHLFLLGIGSPTDEAFKKLSDYFGTRLDIAPITEFDDFCVMDKMLAYVDTYIDLMMDVEVTPRDRPLIKFLLGFSEMITGLPVGLYTSSISNDELVTMNDRACRFIEKFQKTVDR
jgi:transcriptional regulator with XRE-family HTH domain